ncbi:putative regulatory factor Sgt1 [Talaromyces proteolyticus]|uniref:Regulatory factor Sgt1 n=1 Tax=Talaromyces proteolyticus TaxID=1131652 RepID=A0AAD4KJE6_9EURO|nr:putative regulatory factor Sgt1 [Talaromyces proteolyticus]KAH8693004.1 putative regulatory factor Sgt1 [Talaromyces proteolyticus]
MAPMSEEDLAWFKSTFRPIPRPQLPDDAIEYSLYLISSSPTPASADAAALLRTRLQEVQRSASEIGKNLLKDYIWQREGFGLQITKQNDRTFLQGRTSFGDSIEDEWVVVYILRELTRKHKDLWVRVVDSDGEFLLIEAAASLPAWLEPAVADNRVWINCGRLIIINPKNEKKKVIEKISLEESLKIILEDPDRLMHSTRIEEEAFYRLRKYPKQIEENLHRALVTVPRKVAYLLHQKPAYISPVVEAFYIRDPIALRSLKTKGPDSLLFPPNDLVTVSVQFTRVGYAQLKSQDFPAPATWKHKIPSSHDSETYFQAETGMKISCGFEMLLSDPQNQDKPIVREIKLLLEDIDTGDETLPTDEEIKKEWSHQQDDEQWMDISYEDLDSELKGRAGGGSKPGAFGDRSAQENLQRIVARFEEFLNDDSANFEGVDLLGSDTDDDDDGEDDDLSSDDEDQDLPFNEEEFSNMMKEMMAMPSGSGPQARPRPARTSGKVEEIESSDDEHSKIEEISRQMEAELRPTGILDIDPRGAAKQPKSVKGKGKQQQQEIGDDLDDDRSINVNLANNLLESLQSQGGMPGPGSNLLGMMGMKMPRDDRK